MDLKHCFILGSFCIAILVSRSLSEHFQVSSSPSVIGTVGHDVILPCQISLGRQPQSMKVQWQKIANDYINIYQFEALSGLEKFGHGYESRTVLAKEGLPNGNVSLKLKNVQVSDQGSYRCIVKSTGWNDSTRTALDVTGDIFVQTCPWFPAFWALFALSVLVSGVVGCYMYKVKKKHSEDKVCLIQENSYMHENLERIQAELVNLKRKKDNLKRKNEFLDARFCRENVFFDPETAHPRLEVSKDGKCVKDTGNVSNVSKSKKRFDSHIFILAKDGFSKGKHYWEVEVGQKKNWVLGVASESICRTGIIIQSVQNGFWVIKLENGKEYWAQENRLSVKLNEKPSRIGIFLNIFNKSLIFYDAHRKLKLYTFTDSFSEKLYPFFSTGLEADSLPLRIPPYFEEEED